MSALFQDRLAGWPSVVTKNLTQIKQSQLASESIRTEMKSEPKQEKNLRVLSSLVVTECYVL
jgi:hypothetical protein